MITAELIQSLKDARPYGIYKDVEYGPMHDDWNDYPTAVYWDGDTTKDPDTLYEWLRDFYESSVNDLCELEKYPKDERDSKKWSFIQDLEYNLNSFPDISFYCYEMRSTLVGVCLSLNEAKRIVGLINPELNPRCDVLYSSDLKYSGSLSDICEYFRELNIINEK